MPIQWNREQIIALAPDSSSASAAQGLTNVRKWSNLGQNEFAIWGECQGSGANPYQTVIELTEPAFKCSCPSRKFPCKHGLALFLLVASDPRPFSANTPPTWAQTWLDGRAKRKEAQPSSASAKPEKPVDEKAQAKRVADRSQKVTQGVDELRLWLNDLVRGGFADLPTRPNAFWQQTAARLIDAQAPGLATQVQALGKVVSAGEDWADRLTSQVARLHLLLEAWQRIDALPTDTQQDIRTLIGWNLSKDEVLSTPAIAGPWCVLSVRNEINDTLIGQRIWLQHAEQGRFALILNFAPQVARQTLDVHWRSGSLVDCDLHFYPSATPLRSLAGQATTQGQFGKLRHAMPIQQAVQSYKEQVARNPWLTRFPLVLDQVVVNTEQQADGGRRWFIYDADHIVLPLSPRCKTQPWRILSLSGATPVQLFGEWQEDGFFPLGLWHEGHYYGLPPVEETV